MEAPVTMHEYRIESFNSGYWHTTKDGRPGVVIRKDLIPNAAVGDIVQESWTPGQRSIEFKVIKPQGKNKEMSMGARELALYAENDSLLYESSWKPIVANLDKKRAKGIYKSDMALILMKHHANRAAQSYAREFGDGETKWFEMFSVEDRKEAAEHFLRDYETEANLQK